MDKKRISVFVDSDVVISSLISEKGAAHLLLSHPGITRIITDISEKEIRLVVKRLGIKMDSLENLLIDSFDKLTLKENTSTIKGNYGAYVTDINDSHIIAGAVRAKVPFLLTYNTRHFNVELIKGEFGILIFTPAQLLQYLRNPD